MIGVQRDRPSFRFTGSDPIFDLFNAVIRRVAYHMRQRILDDLQNLTVEFRFRADHLQIDLFTEFQRKIPNNPRQLGPSVPDRLHAGLHDPFLQFRCHMTKALQRRIELAIALRAEDLQQLIPRQYEF